MSDQQPLFNHQQSCALHWQEIVLDISQTSTSIALNKLICYLDYALQAGELSAEQALEAMAGEREQLLKLQCQQERNAALVAFDEVAKLKRTVAYVTREFVRRDCGVSGAILSDEDCDRIIARVQRLTIEGKFGHSGVYWIANALAAKGLIRPQLPERTPRN